MKNYKELFVNEFSIAENIDNTFGRLICKEGIEKGLEYLNSINCKAVDIESFLIKYYINQYTLKESIYDTNEILKRISELDSVLEVSIIDKYLNIKRKDYNIEVETFSKRDPNIPESLPDIESIERNGTCYQKAYRISLGLKRPNKIVIGYIYGYTDKSKFLHTWVETTIDGVDLVFDGTLNAIINKEGYYKLLKVNVINEIKKEDFFEDIEKYGEFIDEIGLPVYYVYRDEIINELKKNDELFASSKKI